MFKLCEDTVQAWGEYYSSLSIMFKLRECNVQVAGNAIFRLGESNVQAR